MGSHAICGAPFSFGFPGSLELKLVPNHNVELTNIYIVGLHAFSTITRSLSIDTSQAVG